MIYSDVQGSAGYSRTPPTPQIILSCILPVWQLQVTYADVLVTDQSSQDSKRSQRQVNVTLNSLLLYRYLDGNSKEKLGGRYLYGGIPGSFWGRSVAAYKF